MGCESPPSPLPQMMRNHTRSMKFWDDRYLDETSGNASRNRGAIATMHLGVWVQRSVGGTSLWSVQGGGAVFGRGREGLLRPRHSESQLVKKGKNGMVSNMAT